MAKRSVFLHLLSAAVAAAALVASLPSLAQARQLAQDSTGIGSSAGRSVPSSLVVIESVLPEPDNRHVQSVVVRNIARNNTPADVSGWTLVAASDPGKEYTFPSETILEPGEAIQLQQQKGSNEDEDGGSETCETCFEFDMGSSDAVIMQDEGENVVSVASWSDARTQSKIIRLSEGEYMNMPGDSDTLTSFLKRAGHFDLFLELLDHFHYDRALDGKKDRPSCVAQARGPCYLWYCPPAPPCRPTDEPLPLSRDDGPFTVFALTDQSITALLDEWSGSDGEKNKLTLSKALKDERLEQRLEDVLKYHIIKKESVTTPKMTPDDAAATFDADETAAAGREKSPVSFVHANTLRENNRTTGSNIVFFQNEVGKINIHEDCVDKAPPGDHGCELQAEWGKCEEDWLNDKGAVSGRAFGYCEMSCQRCQCTSDTCNKEIVIPDIHLAEEKDKEEEGEEEDLLQVTVHVLSAALVPPTQYEVPSPPPPPPPPKPVRPPVYVWNPQTHRQEVMAEWNEETQSYQTPEDPLKNVDPSNSLQYSYDYQWNEQTGQYDYIMVQKQGG